MNGNRNNQPKDKLADALLSYAKAERANGIGFNLACLILENIELSSDELNRAYFACARAVNKASVDRKRSSLILL